MNTIVYYISGHGFGHATRSASVISELQMTRPDIRIHIRSWASPQIFNEMCPSVEVTHCQYDIGVVQNDGISMNIPETLRRSREILDQADSSFDSEVELIGKLNPACIVSDIPPLAHRVAEKLNIPSCTVTNFTWDWIYDAWTDLYPEAGILAERIRNDYSKSNCLLRLPYAGDLPAFSVVRDTPMLGRKAVHSKEFVRDQLGLMEESRPVVLFSFGGMGLNSGNFNALELLKDYKFITTFPMNNKSIQVLKALDQYGITYPDLVNAVDVVVTKPGYGIVSECAINHTRMLYTDRGPFREYEVILEQLAQWNCAVYIERDRLLNGNCREELEKLIQMDPEIVPGATEAANADGAKMIAEQILAFADQGKL